jgi:hypothetical protein
LGFSVVVVGGGGGDGGGGDGGVDFVAVVGWFTLCLTCRLILPQGTSLTLLWYGLYFGILGRDCAEVATDRMVRRPVNGSSLLQSAARIVLSHINPGADSLVLPDNGSHA